MTRLQYDDEMKKYINIEMVQLRGNEVIKTYNFKMCQNSTDFSNSDTIF